MSDAIKPALTAEEWAARHIPDADSRSQEIHESEGAWIEGNRIAVCDSIESPISMLTPEKVMALANAALPDDDPRKITRAQLNALDEATSAWLTSMADAAQWAGAPVSAGHGVSETHEALRRLFMAIAALLPP